MVVQRAMYVQTDRARPPAPARAATDGSGHRARSRASSRVASRLESEADKHARALANLRADRAANPDEYGPEQSPAAAPTPRCPHEKDRWGSHGHGPSGVGT
ncbi:hypothetical protein SVEN_3011 [Streptomyces venezuelae ATCC 10712]|uniref:Uncharacterized protein n=1 Tax=Streptomyces venezuelae (strain ATCC 10712 / CBS 650.69 / DSM 40230 / JCM 4526 / NBRC 13096 / PD 04745) TaxID=953739 RepID=F2R7L2_STRVP|nr:hypothetical protein SVEN_3011 [Streptomyces venezuelae ATCC 10712]